MYKYKYDKKLPAYTMIKSYLYLSVTLKESVNCSCCICLFTNI